MVVSDDAIRRAVKCSIRQACSIVQLNSSDGPPRLRPASPAWQVYIIF
jgi:hypothetical protein